MYVDAHHHLWAPLRGDYGWMPEDDPVLSRQYTPEDLLPELASLGITKTVLVQAAPTVRETEYMLGLADATPQIAGVVGWFDFEDQAGSEAWQDLHRHPKLKGARPMIQDLPDDDWMLRDDVQWAYRALVDWDMTFDALGFPRHLPNFLKIFEKYPEMRVVIDHCMKPQITDGYPAAFQPWADGMRRLAEETSAYCKLSGIITEANPDWTVDTLRPYVDHVFEVFGPARIMWGSDWPVSRLRCEYGDWWRAAQSLTEGLSDAEKAMVFGGTATKFYCL